MLTFQTQSYLTERHSGVYPAAMSAETAVVALSEAEIGVWSYTAGARRALLSPTARQILGLGEASEPPDAEYWLDHVHPADQARVQAEIERVAGEAGAFLLEMRVVTVAGDARRIEVDGRSHHEDGRFVRAGGTVRATASRRPADPVRDLRVGASLPCARRLANLGMIAATVIDEMQAVHPVRTIHLVLSGHLDGEWDAERIAQAIANLVAKALEGAPDRPVAVRVSGRGSQVHLLIEGFGPLKRGPFIAREIVRAHGGALHEIPSNAAGTRFLAVLPRRGS